MAAAKKKTKKEQAEEQAADAVSLAADPATVPDTLRVTATTADGEIMAVQHVQYPVYGLQFHPESILTPDGEQIIRYFLAL